MSWKTLVIQNSEKVSLFLDNIVVSKDDLPRKFLISDLNCVIFTDFKILITSRILNKLATNNVLTIFCDETFMPVSIVQPFKGHHMQLKIIADQTNWKVEQKRILWTRIVKQKIENQIDILKINGKSLQKIAKLFQYINGLELSDPTNREGHAAKVYFNELFGNDFTRENESIINSGLNFGYAILRSAFSRSIVSKGLHPSISLFHCNRYDCFALADDLMEPFRPIVDDWVFKNFQSWDYFGREQKIELINLLNVQVFYDNKLTFLNNAINKYIDGIIKFMQGESINKIVFPFVQHLEYYEL